MPEFARLAGSLPRRSESLALDGLVGSTCSLLIGALHFGQRL